MELDEAVERVENALTGSVVAELRRRDHIALAYSGGLDSTILARLLQELADGDVWLVAVGAAGSRDVERARRNARFLELPLVEAAVSEAMLARDLPAIVGLVGRTPVAEPIRMRHGLAEDAQRVNPVLVGILAALFYAFQEAARFSDRILLGQGADELFGGYKRYLGLEPEAMRKRMEEDLAYHAQVGRPIEARVADYHGVEPRYPYLDEAVVGAARGLPTGLLVEGGVRKIVLRRLADRLGLPGDVARVPKTAAQYGTGVAALLRRMANRAGLAQHEWLESILPPAETKAR